LFEYLYVTDSLPTTPLIWYLPGMIRGMNYPYRLQLKNALLFHITLGIVSPGAMCHQAYERA
jgi:hypothetical protein